VGGLTLERGRPVRLLRSDGGNCDPDAPYRVGEVWDVEYEVPADLLAPHLEDVAVFDAVRCGEIPELGQFLRERVQPWEGPPERLFDGLLQPTDTASGYVSVPTGVPSRSVGFWLPDQPLALARDEGGPRYRYPGPHGVRVLSYVGFDPPEEVLPAGTLLRVSLTWWRKNPEAPGQDARCYLQLSGWYR
jgi:hypothetical protein